MATWATLYFHSKTSFVNGPPVSITPRYLYLLFDEDNFIHNRGNVATVVDGPGDGGR